jgi:cell division protein FtsB
MKFIITLLAALFLALQYKLWFQSDGIAQVSRLQQAIAAQTSENNLFMRQNAALAAEVRDLKNGGEAIEEHARNDLGMAKPGEVFYQVVDS